MGAPEYDTLVDELLQTQEGGSIPVPEAAPVAAETAPAADEKPILLERKNIVLGCAPVTPEEAIKACGRLMVDSRGGHDLP